MNDLQIISSALQKAATYTLPYNKICVMISGGSDSDDMLAVLLKTVPKEKLHFLFCNTGIEMKETLAHISALEEKYGIKIEKLHVKTPIPISCKKYGQPFLEKYVSEMISRLQRHNFKWEDEPFDVLYSRYPDCKVGLQWWCNMNGKGSRFNINKHAYLKEFMIKNPPNFSISQKCCQGAKKDVAKQWISENNPDMHCMGIRQNENGVRSQAYKNCFTYRSNVFCQEFRPIFYFTESTKKVWEEMENIEHSKCYSEYKMTRTGCAGCPFGSGFEAELNTLKMYEPNLYVAVNNIFGDSYKYTRLYRRFKDAKKRTD